MTKRKFKELSEPLDQTPYHTLMAKVFPLKKESEELNKLNHVIKKAYDNYQQSVVDILVERLPLIKDYTIIKENAVKIETLIKEQKMQFLKVSFDKEKFNESLDHLVDNSIIILSILKSLNNIKAKILSDRLDPNRFEYLAIEENNFDLIKFLFEKENYNFQSISRRYDDDDNDPTIINYSVLHHAATFGNKEIVDYLINICRLDINKIATYLSDNLSDEKLAKIIDLNEITPNYEPDSDNVVGTQSTLSLAIREGHTDLVKHLITRYKAIITNEDKFMQDALYISIRNNHLELTEFLTENFKFDVNDFYSSEGSVTFAFKKPDEKLIKFVLNAIETNKIAPDPYDDNSYKHITYNLLSVIYKQDSHNKSNQSENFKMILQYIKSLCPDGIHWSRISKEMSYFQQKYSYDPEISNLFNDFYKCFNNNTSIIGDIDHFLDVNQSIV